MKILLVHQLFADPRQPGGTRHYELSQRLIERGHDVTVVTSDLCYLTGERRAEKAAWVSDETVDGIRVLRAYTFAALHRSLAWRIVAFVCFMLTSLWAGLRCGKVDVVVGTSPPIFQLASAWLIAVLRRRPFVLEVRDLWPAFAVDMGVLKNRLVIWLAQSTEAFFYARAKVIIVNSPAYVEYLKERKVPPEKVRLVPNGVDPLCFDVGSDSIGDRVNTFRQQFGLNGQFVVTYAGALGRANDLPTVLAAAERLRDDHRIHFLLVGDGQRRTEIQNRIRDAGLNNITLTGGLPKERMGQVLAASDACLATLLDIPMFRMTYPNKVFDYMAAGRPTVLAIDGVIREVVEAADGGLCVPPGDAAAIAEAVQYLCTHRDEARRMGESARSYVAKHFHRDEQSRQFEAALVRGTGGPPVNGRRRPAACATGHVSSFYARRLKRPLDVVVASVLLLVLCPLLLLIAAAVWLGLGRPIFFVDRRGGMGSRAFGCLKFRTMTDGKDDEGKQLPDSYRLTTLGRFLRATSLDELPQLWNVLRGEMSLVGPRPLSVAYLDRYTPSQARRHTIRPGITGWAQVNGRDSLSWERKFELDVWYIEHVNWRLDAWILLLTAWQMLWPSGVATKDQAAKSEFAGPQLH